MYVNESDDSSLHETMELNIEGLVVEGQDNQNKIEVVVPPGKHREYNLTATDLGRQWKFNSKSSYSIEEDHVLRKKNTLLNSQRTLKN